MQQNKKKKIFCGIYVYGVYRKNIVYRENVFEIYRTMQCMNNCQLKLYVIYAVFNFVSEFNFKIKNTKEQIFFIIFL